MAHEVESAVYSNKPAWHNLGITFEEEELGALTPDRALELSGLDWTVEKKPVGYYDQGSAIPYCPEGDEDSETSLEGTFVDIPGHYATVRNADGKPLGVVGGMYTVVQNHSGFAFLEDICDSGDIAIESAMSLRGGAVVAILARRPDHVVIAGEELAPYLLFTNTHDGSGALQMLSTPTRVVCHARGTRIDDAGWRGTVEDHPSATNPRVCEGKRVRIWGLPFTEEVTNEHRYWTRRYERAKGRPAKYRGDGWTEAKDLIQNEHEIGMPIDMTQVPAPSIPMATHVKEQRFQGRTKTLWSIERDSRLDREEWWWLLGYYLGNGSLHKESGITIAVPDERDDLVDRISALYEECGWSGKPHQRPGCKQITLYDKTLNFLLAEWRREGYSMKVPHAWTERLPLELQRSFVRGYWDADGDKKTEDGGIVVSVCMDLLLSMRRILMRLGIPSAIRNAGRGGPAIIEGRTVNSQPSYSLRFWRNTDQIGLSHRFASKSSIPYIEDGHMWSKVKTMEKIEDGEFWPITTETHDYLTAFGRSHNCMNTLTLALKGARNRFKVRHTSGAKKKIEEARKALGISFRYTEELKDVGEAMVSRKLTDKDFDAFLESLLPIKRDSDVFGTKEEPDSVRTVASREDKRFKIKGLYKNAENLDVVRGTRWGALQAVVEWEQHGVKYKSQERKLTSIISGDQTYTKRAMKLLS